MYVVRVVKLQKSRHVQAASRPWLIIGQTILKNKRKENFKKLIKIKKNQVNSG